MAFADVVGESITNSGTANTSTAINLGGGLTENSLAYRGFVAALGGSKANVPALLVRGTGDDWQTGVVTITDAATDTAQFSRIDASSNAGSAIAFDSSSKIYLINNADSIRGRRAQRRITAAGSQSIGTTAWVKVTDTALDTSDTDPYSLWDAANDRFVLDRIGIWRVFGAFALSSLTDGNKLVVAVYKNGSLFALLGRGVNGGTDQAGFSGDIFVPVTAVTDYVEMFVYHTNAAATANSTTTGYVYFGCEYQGPDA